VEALVEQKKRIYGKKRMSMTRLRVEKKLKRTKAQNTVFTGIHRSITSVTIQLFKSHNSSFLTWGRQTCALGAMPPFVPQAWLQVW